jgi:Ran GTPase-activating protein (RanGAP) involved in mRNA processing and transport
MSVSYTASMVLFAPTCQTNATLISLDLAGNYIGVAGATAIITALQTNNTRLTSLNLTSTGIGDDVATILAAALQTYTALDSLDLCGNDIGDGGATALATALQTNTTLIWLDLCDNGIGDAGATALATALHTNTTLTWLNLECNDIRNAAANALLSARPSCAVHLNPSPIPHTGSMFRDLADCRAKCVQAGRVWNLIDQSLSPGEVACLADVLADPLVRCFPVRLIHTASSSMQLNLRVLNTTLFFMPLP